MNEKTLMGDGSDAFCSNTWSASAIFPTIRKPVTVTRLRCCLLLVSTAADRSDDCRTWSRSYRAQFLEHLESVRGCSGVTRNNRLAAVHSLAKFIGMRSPLHIGLGDGDTRDSLQDYEEPDRLPRTS